MTNINRDAPARRAGRHRNEGNACRFVGAVALQHERAGPHTGTLHDCHQNKALPNARHCAIVMLQASVHRSRLFNRTECVCGMSRPKIVRLNPCKLAIETHASAHAPQFPASPEPLPTSSLTTIPTSLNRRHLRHHHHRRPNSVRPAPTPI